MPTESNYTLAIEDKLKDKLKKIADEHNRSLAGQITTILEDYVDAHKDGAYGKRKDD